MIEETLTVLQSYESDIKLGAVKKLTGKQPYTSVALCITQNSDSNALNGIELRIPDDIYENGKAQIHVSKSHALQYPHVESDGNVCLGIGDIGSHSGEPLELRLFWLIEEFFNSFVTPLVLGELNDDFIKEPLSYWHMNVRRNTMSKKVDAKRVLLDLSPSTSPIIIESKLYSSDKFIFVSDKGTKVQEHYLHSLSSSKTSENVQTAIVPIPQPWAPSEWPNSFDNIEDLVKRHAGDEFTNRFFSKSKSRKSYRQAVVFVCSELSYGYLISKNRTKDYCIKLPNGRIQRKVVPHKPFIPLYVNRVDTSWVTGRDAISSLTNREKSKILVVGCGALGSQLLHLLIQSGVSSLTIVDDDLMMPENLSRHSLGMNELFKDKVQAMLKELLLKYPYASISPHPVAFSSYTKLHPECDFDLIIDASGMDEVASQIDSYRKNTPFIKAWFEPFVAAAHVCVYNCNTRYERGTINKIKSAEWSPEVNTKLPGCASYFQSYTVTSAAYAVAMTAECILEFIDKGEVKSPIVSWLREESFFIENDKSHKLQAWAKQTINEHAQLVYRNHE